MQKAAQRPIKSSHAGVPTARLDIHLIRKQLYGKWVTCVVPEESLETLFKNRLISLRTAFQRFWAKT